MKRFATVDAYIAGATAWQDELKKLREILLRTELVETIKWGAPCYTLEGKNIVGIGAFKSYFGLWFYQGALLSDPEQVLINAQEGKTKALRQWRFQSKKDMKVRLIRAYVAEAIENQQRGEEIKPAPKRAVEMPTELLEALAQDREIETAFDRLTPGRQREYAAYVDEAKRLDTKNRRIAKVLPMIAEGRGLNDQYRR